MKKKILKLLKNEEKFKTKKREYKVKVPVIYKLNFFSPFLFLSIIAVSVDTWVVVGHLERDLSV